MKYQRLGAAAAVLAVLLAAAGCGSGPEKNYFKQADAYFIQGKFEKAVKSYQAYLEKFPKGKDRDRALFEYGKILYYAMDRKPEATTILGQLVNLYPAGDYAYQARIILAGAFRDEAQDYQRAVLEYRWLIRQKPDSPNVPAFQFQIARCYVLARNYEQAVLELGRCLELYPGSPQVEKVWDELGNAHLMLDRPHQALYIFRTFLEKFPESPMADEVRFTMGTAYEEISRYQDALDIYTGLLDHYENREAVEVRIQGVQERLKNKLSDVKPVDYNYRPARKKDAEKKKQ